MAWSAPPTFVSGNVLTATQLNVLTGDLAAGEVPLMVDTGSFFYSTRFPVSTAANTVVSRQLVSDYNLAFETTTSTVLADLTDGTFGPFITFDHGASVLVMANCQMQSDQTSASSSFSWQFTGDNTILYSAVGVMALVNNTAATNNLMLCCTGVRTHTGLTPGQSSLTMGYQTTVGGVGTFGRRHLTAWPF